MEKKLTLIVRSSEERSSFCCKKLLARQFPEDQIVVVKEAPFSAALKKCLKIGIERGCKWTLCIDADVFIDTDVISRLMEFSENAAENMFEIQGLVLDKFFPILRPAGNHLYRTALMELALEHIPEEGTSLRPESDMLNEMAAIGYSWQQIDLIVGLLDFKQYYCDIYRKCFLQAHKHSQFVSFIEPYWDSKKNEDNDFLVALMAMRSGKEYNKNIFVDKNFLNSEAKSALATLKLTEKEICANDCFPESFVADMLETHDHSNKFIKELQAVMFPHQRWKITSQAGRSRTRKRYSIFNYILQLFVKK